MTKPYCHILEQELDAWSEADRRPTLWWRDDDAVTKTTELERLLEIATTNQVPIALAIVPSGATVSLVRCLAKERDEVAALQHGFAHKNHVRVSKKLSELGSDRLRGEIERELVLGQRLMSHFFGDRSIQVLVPPWNRISPDVVSSLPAMGYVGLSTEQPRIHEYPTPRLRQVNCHVDVMRWRPEPDFRGEQEVIAQLVSHLRRRRIEEVDPKEPTGLLTHHLVHNFACWKFLGSLLSFLTNDGRARFLNATEVFAEGSSIAT